MGCLWRCHLLPRGPGSTSKCSGISCTHENILEKISFSPFGQIWAFLLFILQVEDLNAHPAVCSDCRLWSCIQIQAPPITQHPNQTSEAPSRPRELPPSFRCRLKGHGEQGEIRASHT